MTDSDQAIEIYERNAAALAEQYESLGTGPDFLHLIPPAEPGAIALDIGAGSGRRIRRAGACRGRARLGRERGEKPR